MINSELKWLVQREWLEEAPWAGVERDPSAWKKGELMLGPRGDPSQPLEQGDSAGAALRGPVWFLAGLEAGSSRAADESAPAAVICACAAALQSTAQG